MAQWLKHLPAMQETWVRSLGREDPLEKERNVNPLQYSCLENPMDRGAWWATVHGVAKRWTRLSDFTQVITVLTTTIITEMAKLSFTEHLLSTQVKFMEYGSILSPLKFQNHYVLARRSWPSYLNFSVPLLLHL